ncbi:hypothetical protein G6L94_28565 [Agrobacterium rhizogenes]|nr:hypothetical protein [Rhizobium rhizogenes]NTI97653.1 hypothetical protein [Rhizobium rhizogenes]NTJ60044.1 hypothetical protein [Rhizobium rhizogenes]
MPLREGSVPNAPIRRKMACRGANSRNREHGIDPPLADIAPLTDFTCHDGMRRRGFGRQRLSAAPEGDLGDRFGDPTGLCTPWSSRPIQAQAIRDHQRIIANRQNNNLLKLLSSFQSELNHLCVQEFSPAAARYYCSRLSALASKAMLKF